MLGLIDTSNPQPHSGGAGGHGAVVLTPGKAIEVLLPGTNEFVSLGNTASVPNGTTIKTGSDEVAITSVDKSGKRQTGYFWGGTFKVNALTSGLVELKFVSDFSACGPAKKKSRGVIASASTSNKKSKKAGSLWGRDTGGKFRTKGRSSVATVRGTRWYTEDRCNGTLTRVTEGKVSVKPKKGKTKLVTAGKSFFAKR